MKRMLLASLLLLCCAVPGAAQEPADNAEMAAIVAADQAVRSGGPVDSEEMIRGDAERRRQTRALIEQGVLTTANDFYAAALVFQHGAGPDDYLLAHVLAVRALALGRADAEWLAAATLDRFLTNAGRSQIYGTQFRTTPEGRATMEPYDRALLTDALRVAAGTHTLAEQEARLPEMEAMMRALAPAADP